MRPEDLDRSGDADDAKTVRLADYLPPKWLAEETRLVFRLYPTATRVTATIRFRRNGDGPADLRLDGHSMKLVSAAVDGAPLAAEQMSHEDEALIVAADALPRDSFVWTCETEIDPSANTALEGLYMSNGMYCTQCEAEGFRKITYYPDRPDVMARFFVRIESDLPVLLSNGNPVRAGETDGVRFAEWEDPWPKPAYLFALVAGELASYDDAFTTMSGRKVDLRVWVRPGDEDRCAYAMDALKRSMRWDEEVYGREYDLDLFQIVAVDDFNMGAMENKGLNIFNSKYVLASPETATDRDYELIESIIAHEYFHNWTGNRITCRDWFQLCLKEGLTVYRDQQFSADERSAAVTRINDVIALRARQFQEDGGPLAHPVRPEEYIEINNFYTATVYEKGAEVIGMLRRLVGADGYRKALDLYFDRHDGEACTIEDWLKVFEDATGRDLARFKRWYSQAGTPRVAVEESYEDGVYALTLRQKTPPTPGQPDKAPQVIPCAYGFLAPDGREIGAPGLLELTEASQTWRFELPERPVPSLFRGFSAPVIVERSTTAAERALLLAHDPDPFNRWEAGRAYGIEIARALIENGGAGDAPTAWTDALGRLLTDDGVDPAFRALALDPPGAAELAAETSRAGGVVDPDAIHAALTSMTRSLGERLAGPLAAAYDALADDGPYSPDAAAAGRRALRNRCLAFLVAAGGEEARAAAKAQFDAALGGRGSMTDALAALRAMVHEGTPDAANALAAFRAKWAHDPLVMDKWYSIQATSPAEGALDVVRSLADAPDFPWRNPNKFRALIGAFAMANQVRFHQADGAGYRFFADRLIAMDDVNPQTAARVAGAFETWRRFGEKRQALMQAELERILAKPSLSKDMAEIAGRILG